MLNIFTEIREIRSELARISSSLARLHIQLNQNTALLEKRLTDVERSTADAILTSAATISAQLSRLEAVIIPSEAARVLFYQLVDGNLVEVSQMQMKVDEVKKIIAKPVDKFGNDAAIEDGSALWSLSDPALGSLAPAADGKSADFTPAGQVGSGKIQFSADADLGAGVVTISGELDVDLLPGQAVAVQLSAQ